MRATRCLLAFALLAGCEHEVPPPIPVAPVAPMRGAAGNSDLRVMLSDVASSKACGMIVDGFRGLRAPDAPDVVTGVLWIRDCEISNDGTHVTFEIKGNGWLWVDQTKSKAGGSFIVRQYVRFGVDATIRGALDIAYDRKSHVVTLWFTPDQPPAVAFRTIGDIEVERDGVWSSIVGALGTAFATSPEAQALSQATSQGTTDLSARLADGLAVTINLCTGLRRVELGRSPKGEMGEADVGESRSVPVDVQPGGVIMIGPQIADDGMTLKAIALAGAVRLDLVCAKDADTLASEYINGQIASSVPILGTTDVRDESRLRIKSTRCPVVVVATALDDAPARFAWERPTAEIARSTGGSLVRCHKPNPRP
jgi:hypothetical protein